MTRDADSWPASAVMSSERVGPKYALACGPYTRHRDIASAARGRIWEGWILRTLCRECVVEQQHSRRALVEKGLRPGPQGCSRPEFNRRTRPDFSSKGKSQKGGLVRPHLNALRSVAGTLLQSVGRGRRRAFALIGVMSVALAVIGISVVSAAGQEPPNQKVTLCHRTADEKMPYVEITVDENAIANVILGQNGHATHTGPIFPDTGPDGKWGDIIPAFNIPPNSFGGLNNTTQGLAILANGCQIPTPPTSAPPTTAGPTPTTAPPTTAPPGTAPPRTAPPVTSPPVSAAAVPGAAGAAGQAGAAAAVAGQPRTTG